MNKFEPPRNDDTPWGAILTFQLLLVVSIMSSCVGLWIERGAPAWP